MHIPIPIDEFRYPDPDSGEYRCPIAAHWQINQVMGHVQAILQHCLAAALWSGRTQGPARNLTSAKIHNPGGDLGAADIDPDRPTAHGR